MPDSGVVFDASTDRLLITSNVLNMNADYTVIGRTKLNSDLNAAGIIFVLNDNNIASLAADYIGVQSDGTGLAIDAVVAGTTTAANGTQLKVGTLFTWALVRRGNRLEGWLNGQLNCFLNVSISGRATATRLELGAGTTSNLSRTAATTSGLIAYPYALDPRSVVMQMGCLEHPVCPNVYGFWMTPKGTTYRTHDFGPNRRDFTEGGTLADAPIEPLPYDPIVRWWVRGKFTWNATLSGGVTPSGALINKPTKVLSGGATPTGALTAVKIAIVNLSGSVSSIAGVLVKQPKKLFTGGATPAGTLTNQPKKLLTGGSTPSGALVNRANKVLSGAVSSIVGVLVKTPKKVFSGGATPSGTLTNQPKKLLAGTVATITGLLINQPKKILSGGITPTGSLSAIKIAILNVSGTVSSIVGVLVKQPKKLLSGGATPSGSLINQARKVLAGGLTPSGALNAIKTSLLFVSGSITPTGLLTKRPTKLFSGSTTPTGALVKQPVKRLSGSTTPSGAVRLQTTKMLAGVVGSVGSLIKTPRKVLGGLIAAIGDFLGTFIGGTPETGDGIPPVLVRPIRVDVRQRPVHTSLIIEPLVVAAIDPLLVDIRQPRIVYDVRVRRIPGND